MLDKLEGCTMKSVHDRYTVSVRSTVNLAAQCKCKLIFLLHHLEVIKNYKSSFLFNKIFAGIPTFVKF